MSEREYRLEVSTSTKIVTAVALTILAAFGVYCLESGVRETLLFSFLALAVFLLFLMMPTSIAVDGCTLTVKRVVGRTRIDVSGIERIEVIEELGRGLLLGSAGLFGWYGVFVVRGETALVYSRKERDLVLVRVRGRNYVFGTGTSIISQLKRCMQSEGSRT